VPKNMRVILLETSDVLHVSSAASKRNQAAGCLEAALGQCLLLIRVKVGSGSGAGPSHFRPDLTTSDEMTSSQ
jgi:hypothetical protein